MQDEVHKLREHLAECNILTERLSSAMSAQALHPDMAPFVDALRHSVLTAMRVAHMAETAAKLIYGDRES